MPAHLIVSGRADTAPDFEIPGSAVRRGDCGCDVLVSPASQKMLDDPDIETELSCIPCVLLNQAKMREILRSVRQHGTIFTSPGGIEELESAIGIAGRKAVEALIGYQMRESL